MILYFEFMFLLSMGSILFFKNHYLMILLVMELMTIMIILGLSVFSSIFEIFILMMTIMVLEGAFGLSILMFSSRKSGADMFSKTSFFPFSL